MAYAITQNGTLRSMFDELPVDDADTPRSQQYDPVDIGQPLVVEYLYIQLAPTHGGGQDDEVLISSLVKTEEQREAAAEAITAFRKGINFSTGPFQLDDWGGAQYGHPLCYYTGSYLGEAVRITTRASEIDGEIVRALERVRTGVSSISSLPIFMEFLPFVLGVNTGLKIVSRVSRLFKKDEILLRDQSVDLEFDRTHARRLQSGRVVGVPAFSDDQALIDSGLKLTKQSRLIDANDQDYAGSYFVLRVNRKKMRKYEDFDHFQGAAAILALTNRQEDVVQASVDALVEIARGVDALRTITDIEELYHDRDEDEVQAQIKALFKLLPRELQIAYEKRLEGVL